MAGWAKILMEHVLGVVFRQVSYGVIVVDAQFLSLIDQVFFAANECESASDAPVAFPEKCTATAAQFFVLFDDDYVDTLFTQPPGRTHAGRTSANYYRFHIECLYLPLALNESREAEFR